jgi:hypothetical protein
MSVLLPGKFAVRVVCDLEECRELWNRAIPAESVTDRWDFRACFQRHFDRPAHFLSIDDGGGQVGLLPLSWIGEIGTYGYFPGEYSPGGAWIERSRIAGSSEEVIAKLIGAIPTPCRIRYLVPPNLMRPYHVPDETGYVFVPEHYSFDFGAYMEAFSRTSRRRMHEARADLIGPGARYRYNCRTDVVELIRLNETRFGSRSYFADPRFKRSFLDLAALLAGLGMLRVTTVLIGGVVAAVDLGSIDRGTYTLFAGGTNGDFPGVAKLINFHHIEWACRERLACVDFLSGDFFWKKQFHLTPRPFDQLVRA